jgi:nucleoside-diphosphate-sugar epimerase
MTDNLPSHFTSIDALDEYLSRPTPEVIDAMRALDGDLLILGVGGKMGPSLAALARRACDQAGIAKRIIGVSRFSSAQAREQLEAAGIEAIACDLLDEAALAALPDAPNIIYMAGMKFGATGREAQTWALNAFLPGMVVRRFRRSRFVLFSSGNVYPFVPVASGGCAEATPPAPVGEYAMSVLGRERVFEHFARELDVPGLIFRLNYAVEMRYGVLLDVAQKVWTGEPIDLGMGYANVIWQGDANALALRALALAETPPRVLNVTGPETISIRALAAQFGRLLGREPLLIGSEQPNALLSNAGLAHALLGRPRVPLDRVIEWAADWVRRGGPTLGKPTKFETRDGRF